MLVEQVINANAMIVSRNRDGVSVWLEPVNTAGLTDGRSIAFEQALFVSGTKSYATAIGGQRTILQAVPFKASDFIANDGAAVVEPPLADAPNVQSDGGNRNRPNVR